MSCLAEQAKILFAEALENKLGLKALNERWRRWDTCSLCEQEYHGVVACALGWACWKTYVGRPVRVRDQIDAMNLLGNGLSAADHDEDALSVMEAELSMKRRVGESEHNILVAQSNLAGTYEALGRPEALQMNRDVYSGWLRLHGEEHEKTLRAASNYAVSLKNLERFEGAKSVLRKTIPVARRVLGESHESTLTTRLVYAKALYKDPVATLDDLREAVSTFEDAGRIARRVLGGAHPVTGYMEGDLQKARAVLDAREGDVESAVESVRAAVEAMAPGDA